MEEDIDEWAKQISYETIYTPEECREYAVRLILREISLEDGKKLIRNCDGNLFMAIQALVLIREG